MVDFPLWSWKITPDYREPLTWSARLTMPMFVERSPRQMDLWLGDAVVDRRAVCGDAACLLAPSGDLLGVSVTADDI